MTTAPGVTPTRTAPTLLVAALARPPIAWLFAKRLQVLGDRRAGLAEAA